MTPDEFENVTIVKRANIYFDGKVSSRTVLFPDGTRKTLGLMLPGDYVFKTSERELMEILEGELEVLLPKHKEWKKIVSGQSFEVPANSSFKLSLKTAVDYCCTYG